MAAKRGLYSLEVRKRIFLDRLLTHKALQSIKRKPRQEMSHVKQISLKEARENSGKHAQRIADELGISRSQLYRIESGESQASPEVQRRMRSYWPKNSVPDMAIYDPKEFQRKRGQSAAA